MGDGAIDYTPVVRAAESVGVEWLLVEQDACDGSPIEAIRRSFAALTPIAGTAA